MKISDLEKVQDYLSQLKRVRYGIAGLIPSNIISVTFSIPYRQDVYVGDDDVISKIADVVKEHFKKQEQEIIKKLLELGVTVENEN